MKKLIVSLCAVVCSMSLFATQTSAVRVKLTGSDPTYSVSKAILIEDDARTPAAEDGYDVSCNMTQSNDNSTLIYGLISGSEYSTVSTNDLTSMYIGFKTNNVDVNYTLTFEAFSGAPFTIYDRVAGELITVNSTTPPYAFSVAAELKGRHAINDRFIINYEPNNRVVCFIGNKLTIENNPYLDDPIVIKDANGDAIAGSPFAANSTEIDMTSIGAAGDRFTVEFAGGGRKFTVIKK